jgi:hypothetical protein
MSSYGISLYDVCRSANMYGFSDEPLSLEHVKVVVEAQEKFLTEFAQIKL